MREIKFRAFDKDSKRMHFFQHKFGFCFEGDWYISFSGRVFERQSGTGGDFEVENIELMQYVGAKDVDGNDIYEGDIYRMEEELNNGDYRTYFVAWYIKEWGMFAWLTVEEYNDYLESGVESLDEPMYWTFPIKPKDACLIKLCGNIYENPELLNYEPNAEVSDTRDDN